VHFLIIDLFPSFPLNSLTFPIFIYLLLVQSHQDRDVLNQTSNEFVRATAT